MESIPLTYLLVFEEWLHENPSPAPQSLPYQTHKCPSSSAATRSSTPHEIQVLCSTRRASTTAARGQAELNSSTVSRATPAGKHIKGPLLSSVAVTLWGEKES